MLRRVLSRPRLAWLIALVPLACVLTACGNGHLVLTDQAEAIRLASVLRAEFNRLNEAANRAVMADTEDASKAGVTEAAGASAAVEKTAGQLRPILQALKYSDDLSILDSFTATFADLKTLDAEILSLAVENTNVKAQRLSFTTGAEAADAFVTAVNAAVGKAPASRAVEHAAWEAIAAVQRIQIVQPRHIAEAGDEAMTAMEKQMQASEADARRALQRLDAAAPRPAKADVAAAATALDTFIAVNRQIVELSRRNSNVRSLALTLGRKRVLAAQGTDALQRLEQSLGQHQFKATR